MTANRSESTMRALAIIAIGTVALAGCEASPTTAPSAAPTTTTTTTTAPPPTRTTPSTARTLSREQAASRYLALGKPINDVFDEPKCKQAEDFFVNGGSWPPDDQPTWDERADRVLRGCYKRLVPLYEKTIKALQTTAWPADALADVADLISLDQAVMHCLKQGARAATSNEMYKALECFPADDGSADRVRARFGLPGRTPS